jgi:multiple sugar transport system substrate-binding protein/raffinose/stachyose/melibiose transport system substrate-binding protein
MTRSTGTWWRRGAVIAATAALLVSAAPVATLAQDEAGGEVKIMTYFSADFGEKALAAILEEFTAETGITVNIAPIDHENYKTAIFVQLAAGSPPDAFTDWAGARAAFKVKNGSLLAIDDMWAANDLDSAFPAGMIEAAATYDGAKYVVPFGYHYAGMFYNPKVMESAGVAIPTTWDELLAACGTLTAAGITPIALGSKEQWPAQFWLDYLLLRTAGPEYRARLMSGEASYSDPEVITAMTLWQDAANAGCFTEDANAYVWTDAASAMYKGEAAMNLMGTWITGYLDGLGAVAGTDYDFFEFPTLDPSIPNAVVGPVDGWEIGTYSRNQEGAKQLLAFLAGPEAQTEWAVGQGALPPNVNADTSQLNSVLQKALAVVAASPSFNFNYDLATPPPVATVGLNMFAEFLADPSQDLAALMAKTDEAAKKAFAQS